MILNKKIALNKKMNFIPENIYHVYNRGNNRQQIFFEERNYLFFLNKVKNHLCKYSDILAYCLMPNHFHLLIFVKKENEVNNLNNEIGTILRSYTRAINIQEERTGSLFQQKTQAKNVGTYGAICINYIHQNPVNAGISDKIELWKYSSFNEYLGKSVNRYCNIELGMKLMECVSVPEFYEHSYKSLDKDIIEKFL